MGGEERLRERKVDDRVAEEFEALVVPGNGVRVLVQPAGVDEGLLDEVGFADGEAQPLREGGGGSHGSQGRGSG